MIDMALFMLLSWNIPLKKMKIEEDFPLCLTSRDVIVSDKTSVLEVKHTKKLVKEN